MLYGKKICVVMPAYNAEKTLRQTVEEIPHGMVDDIILVDDASTDRTLEVAAELGLNHIIRHEKNKGYGGNQKSCYDKALETGSDIIIMVHPDYQYTPRLIPAMAHYIAGGLYPVVLGSRILGRGAIRGGMPPYKYFFNRLLTLSQNLLMRQKLSEYHTGYRAFSAEVLRAINYKANDDDFVFDNQMLAQIFMAGYEIAEMTCPTRYFTDASSINFARSVKYGLGVLNTSLKYRLHKWGWIKARIFRNPGNK